MFECVCVCVRYVCVCLTVYSTLDRGDCVFYSTVYSTIDRGDSKVLPVAVHRYRHRHQTLYIYC